MRKMKTETKTVLFRVLTVGLTLGWLLFIFSNSLKSGIESGEQSAGVYEFVNRVARALGFRGEISESFLRRLAHFGEFAILGWLIDLSALSFWDLPRRMRKPWQVLSLLGAVPLSALCACIDEWLQTFSEGRAAELADVLTDTLGALTGSAVFAGGVLLFWALHRKKDNNYIKEKENQS